MKFSLLTLGTIAAGLGCYGAFEHALKLEGGSINYLVLAAPVVGAAAALCAYYAECCWRERHWFKAVLWTLVLIPTAATVFYAAAERVHALKAGAHAERIAARSAVTRAELALTEAKAKATQAEADAKAMRKQKTCKVDCQRIWDTEASNARGRVEIASKALDAVQAKATDESPLQMPIWLLPMALDLFSFLAIWTGLALQKRQQPVDPRVGELETERTKLTETVRELRRKLRKPTPPKPPNRTPPAAIARLVVGVRNTK